MKTLTVVSIVFGLTLAATAAYADSQKSADMGFEEHKKMMLEHVDNKISLLNEKKTCVAAATNKDDLKKCHDNMEEKEDQMKAKHHEMCGKHKGMCGKHDHGGKSGKSCSKKD